MIDTAARRYPTYKADQRDILLIEFEEAQKIANSQTKLYGQVANILLAIIALIIPLFIDSKDTTNNLLKIIQDNSLAICTIFFVFGWMLLRYFTDLQKQITINARKVVTLRLLLGLNYGAIHLTLPHWRVEGATNPFAIKYFYGWFKFRTVPFWILCWGVNFMWYFTVKDRSPLVFDLLNISVSWFIGHIIIIISYGYTFRTHLNDTHETNFLSFTKIIAWLLRVKILKNTEKILYEAKLAFIELERLNVNFVNLKKVLIEIEDSTFYQNNGISLKSLVRGILSRFRFFRTRYGYISSGGSTITMQLVRTLFIGKSSKYGRKVIELLLALWITKQFAKGDILKLYIASVRYEKGVLGLSEAVKYFWGSLKHAKISNEHAFFLVERLSNVSSTINDRRLAHLMRRVTVDIDKDKLLAIYTKQLDAGRLTRS